MPKTSTCLAGLMVCWFLASWSAHGAGPQKKKEPPRIREVPKTLKKVAWSKGPLDVIKNPDPDEGLIWLGVLEDIKYEKSDTGTNIWFLFRYLELINPCPKMLADHVFKARLPRRACFAVSLRTGASEDMAKKMQKDFLSKKHYGLVPGKLAEIVVWNKCNTVVLEAHGMEVSDKLDVTIVEQN
jgi:hypothetical protein